MALRGVNLGGWLVLEPWITPSLFKNTTAVDEYTFCQSATPKQLRQLKHHRDTFITEEDFRWLAEQGVQVVRLPVGYWLFDDTPPFVSTKAYVEKAFVWTHRHGLRILLDLHGAPGSQNGEMHSGQQGDVDWHNDPANIEATLNVLGRLVKRYGQHPVLLGISFLNEPSPHIPRQKLQHFYKQAYGRLRPLLPPDAWLVFSDAFRPTRWYHRLPRRNYPNLYVDHHHYQLFSALDRRLSVRQQLWRTRHTLPGQLRRMARHHPLIIGEWSGALRSEKLAKLSLAERQQFTQQYIQAQERAFAPAAAHFYWTYKTESAGAWNFRDTVTIAEDH